MQLFLSWSGDRSKMVAEGFANWIRLVIQAVEPWISSDIAKGARWNREIATRLEESKVGIFCLTRDNVNERWILFEAGALSKTHDAQVCTLLLDLTPTDVEQPLGQFQHTTNDKADIKKLVGTINEQVRQCGERALSDPDLEALFENNWSRLEGILATAAAQPVEGTSPQRSESDLLQEILETVRNIERRQGQIDDGSLAKTPSASISDLERKRVVWEHIVKNKDKGETFLGTIKANLASLPPDVQIALANLPMYSPTYQAAITTIVEHYKQLLDQCKQITDGVQNNHDKGE